MSAVSPELADRLRSFSDPDHYVRVPGTVVFDAHEERDDKGRLVRCFDRARLERIASNSNTRDAEGNFCPLTIGHTKPGAETSEEAQPEIVGAARHFRVAWSPDLKRWVIQADYFIRRDRFAKARTFPRTSVELWPDDEGAAGKQGGDRANDGDFFDPIALLRRTPQRDLGSWTTYSRSATGRQVLRYSRDYAMADMPEMMPPEEAAAEPTHDQKVERFLRHTFSHPDAAHMAKHYGMEEGAPMEEPADPTGPVEDEPAERYSAGPGMPSATDVCPPGTRKDVGRMQRDQDAIRFARFEKRMVSLEKALADKDAEVQRYRRDARKESFERQLVQMEAEEGVEFDRAEELDTLMGLTDEQAERHLTKMATRYARSPVGGTMAPIHYEKPARETSAQERDAACRLASRNGWHGTTGYDKALAEIRKGGA